MHLWKKKLFTKILVALLVVIAIAGFSLWRYVENIQQPAQVESSPVVFTVGVGESLISVASRLEAEGIIKSSYWMRFVASQQALASIKAGKFLLDASWDVVEILTVLNDPTATIIDQIRITLPEGFWAKHMAKRLGELTSVDENDLLELWNNREFVLEMIDRYDFLSEEVLNDQVRVLLEGYLFPETYDFFVETSARAITLRLLDQFDRIYKRHQDAILKNNLSLHQLIILASIVQYEAADLENMKLIAGVFYNRLAIRMPLQASPTVCYSLYEFDSWLDCERNANFDSPYNTYKYAGLPVGPILNPSEMALIAVLEPTASNYYYFMADVYGDKTIYYARTLAEHQANVNKYLKGRR